AYRHIFPYTPLFRSRDAEQLRSARNVAVAAQQRVADGLRLGLLANGAQIQRGGLGDVLIEAEIGGRDELALRHDDGGLDLVLHLDRKSTRLNSSHVK